jgi:hypothetical protein
MSPAFAKHDVDAVLDYSFDWSKWLSDGATISQSGWSAPAGIQLSQQTVLGNVTIVRVAVTDTQLEGATVEIVNHVEASDGQEDDRTLRLFIGQK